MPPRRLTLLLAVVLCQLLAGVAFAQKVSLKDKLDGLVEDGTLIAAQVVTGQGNQIGLDYAVGVTSPSGNKQVDNDTLFCIGSCSKPFASAIVMSLVDEGLIDLEQPIDKQLSKFGALKLADGTPSARAPNMRELLAHRAGIYSQKRGMNKRQARWIRDFNQTLNESVDGIAGEGLIYEPGAEYAYSGAGYCVAGRVGEVASGKTFEDLLQSRIAKPLGLQRTTYFPAANDKNVAAGGRNGKPNPATPHLAKPKLRFTLVGGSLYSTARESSRFLRMTAQRGEYDNNTVIKKKTWGEWISRPYDGNYGYGWISLGQEIPPTDRVLTHSGSLASSRSCMIVSLKLGVYGAVHYTVGEGAKNLDPEIRRALSDELFRLAKVDQ